MEASVKDVLLAGQGDTDASGQGFIEGKRSVFVMRHQCPGNLISIPVEPPTSPLILISRRFRAMALLSKKEIIQSRGSAKTDLACIWKERVTLVSLPTRSSSHVSSIRVANRDSGAENSLM